jgi:hypothetical protein
MLCLPLSLLVFSPRPREIYPQRDRNQMAARVGQNRSLQN